MKSISTDNIELQLISKNNVDFVAFGLDGNNKLTTDNFIFYNNIKNDYISVLTSRKLDGLRSVNSIFSINLSKAPENIKRILITSMTMLTNLTVSTNEYGHETNTTYDLTDNKYPYKIAIVAEYVKRGNVWYNKVSSYELINYTVEQLINAYYDGVVLTN
jgi:stress response protein SCP2